MPRRSSRPKTTASASNAAEPSSSSPARLNLESSPRLADATPAEGAAQLSEQPNKKTARRKSVSFSEQLLPVESEQAAPQPEPGASDLATNPSPRRSVHSSHSDSGFRSM